MPDAGDAIAALDAFVLTIEDSTRQLAKRGARLVQRLARAEVAKITGDLAASIQVSPEYTTGDGVWHCEVGPTIIYGRQHELGGYIYPHGHPFLRWEFTGIGSPSKDGYIFVREVYQEPHPYLKPASDQSEAGFWFTAVDEWTMAIERI